MTTIIEAHDPDSRREDYAPRTAVEVSVLPTCDICVYVERRTTPERALFDGATVGGSWANMCIEHMKQHGVGLGLGKGQRLLTPGLGHDIAEAMKRHPAGSGR